MGVHLQARDIPNTLEFAEKNGIDHNAVIGALKSLVADDYVTMVAEDHEAYKLLAEGEAALQNGSPEAQVYKLVKDEGSGKDEIEALAGALAKVGLSQCMQAKWLKIDKARDELGLGKTSTSASAAGSAANAVKQLT